jgi:membrane protease YdiL (CAAX protease family)
MPTTNSYTWLGLLLTYVSVSLTRFIFTRIFGEPLDDIPFIFRELINLGTVVLLFWLILKKEKLPLSSIGISRRPWKETALWTGIIFVLTLGAMLLALLLCKWMGLPFGDSTAFDKLSAFSITLVCLRAGILEEVFMRGYQLERWNSIFQNKWVASALSLLPFALLHYTQGWSGIIISFAAGAVLTATYWWKRNLPANMIAHFLIDFLANIGR